jgi:hypothetical protein
MLDAVAQVAAVQQELNRLEGEHLRLVIQDPEPAQDTASFHQQQDLEKRIKRLQAALVALEKGEDPSPPAKKAVKPKKAAAKKATSNTEPSENEGADSK